MQCVRSGWGENGQGKDGNEKEREFAVCRDKRLIFFVHVFDNSTFLPEFLDDRGKGEHHKGKGDDEKNHYHHVQV